MTAYATRADIYALGLDPQAFAPRPRALEAADPATGVLTLTGHGLLGGSLLRFVVEGAAVPGRYAASLPSGLSASVVYTAEPVSGSSDLFRVAPVGGAAIVSFADAGAGVFSIIVDPGPVIDRIAENVSRTIDEHLTGHAPPILPNPLTGRFDDILVGVCARWTALEAVSRLGLSNPIYKDRFDEFRDRYEIDRQMLRTWVDGRGIRVNPLDQTALPDNAMRATNSGPAVPWERRTCSGGRTL